MKILIKYREKIQHTVEVELPVADLDDAWERISEMSDAEMLELLEGGDVVNEETIARDIHSLDEGGN